jgi:hypothetical protein
MPNGNKRHDKKAIPILKSLVLYSLAAVKNMDQWQNGKHNDSKQTSKMLHSDA